MKKVLEIILHYVKKFEIVLIVLMAMTIVSVIAAQVFMRFFFNKPFNWAEELATLLLIYLSYFAADVVYKEKGHISVDYFIGKLPHMVRNIINIAIYSVIMIFLIVMIPQTYTLVRMQFRIITSAAIVVPKSFYTLPVLLVFPSMLLSTVYYLITEVEIMIKHGKNVFEPDKPEEPKYL